MIKMGHEEANPIYPVPVPLHEPSFQALVARIRS
jgi:hypothetical protein